MRNMTASFCRRLTANLALSAKPAEKGPVVRPTAASTAPGKDD
mgnify:CR=1 FL=1|jgi:hypothetical protein